MWNNERALSLLLVIAGIVGLYAALQMPLAARFTLGPGAAPLIYAIAVIICGAGVLLRAPKEKDGAFKGLYQMPGRLGFIFTLLCFSFAAALYAAGFGICLFVYSILGLMLLGHWKFPKAVLFSAIWAFGIYYVFANVLGIQLEEGFLVEWIKGYFGFS